MRATLLGFAAASCLLASAAAKCPDMLKTELAAVAACGNQDELAACLIAGDSCIHGCMSSAGCTDEEAKSFANWLANDCVEPRVLNSSDLKKRQRPAPAPADNEEEDNEDEEERPKKSAPEPEAAAPAPAPAAQPEQPSVVETPAPVAVAAAQEPEAPAVVTVVAPDVTQTAETEAKPPPLQANKSLICLTTDYKVTTVCRKPPGATKTQCEPTESAEVKCMPGLLCMRTEKGQEVCMEKINTPILSGIIVTCCLSVFAGSMLGWIIWAGCTSRAEARRARKQEEAKAIADGMKQEMPGGASEAYLPLIHEPAAGQRGRVRDSSADPSGGSMNNSRRPSRLGMSDGYGGIGNRSPVESRAPSPLGMPGATEDISYGGRR